ncbi:MAG: SpoIIE family protein phosphatase, partial [Armatimonadota bacterium]
NERYSQISGRSAEDLSLLRLDEITHPDERPQIEALFSRLIESGEEFGIDLRLVRPDGSHLWVGCSLSLIRRKAEEPLYVQVVSIDLTERKQAEEVKERLQQRERNIATQLQEALIPSEPSNLPGLSLTSFYRPALTDEAGVGGDFFDVFSLEKGCTALVVGDLSGKGLSAASQVAVVRNMLRYAVYTGSTLVEAVSHLNRVLAEQNLLTGFATLFVAAYDQPQRTLTYVNCGQEPALIWRQETSQVEELGPTGPVLGGFQEGVFTERVVHLGPGDVITVFTDGLTEVGPTRKRFLEVEGVADLLSHCCAANAETAEERERGAGAKYIRDSLIQGVDAFARNGIRDDIALLIGIVEGSDRII